MAMLLILFFPIILIGAAGALGLWTMRLFYGNVADDDRLVVSTIVAVGIPVAGACAVVVSQAKFFQEVFGSFTQFVWMWTLGSFIVGLFIGWADCRAKGR
jgi:hypothetical protein